MELSDEFRKLCPDGGRIHCAGQGKGLSLRGFIDCAGLCGSGTDPGRVVQRKPHRAVHHDTGCQTACIGCARAGESQIQCHRNALAGGGAGCHGPRDRAIDGIQLHLFCLGRYPESGNSHRKCLTGVSGNVHQILQTGDACGGFVCQGEDHRHTVSLCLNRLHLKGITAGEPGSLAAVINHAVRQRECGGKRYMRFGNADISRHLAAGNGRAAANHGLQLLFDG